MPGRQFKSWIGETLRRRREEAGIPIGMLTGPLASEDTLKRIEGAQGPDKQSYQTMDDAVAVYAYALGLDDPRELFIDALELWFKEGAAPQASGADTQSFRFLRSIRDESRRQRQAPPAPEERLDAIRKQMDRQRKRRGEG